jgi:hypothetical protein
MVEPTKSDPIASRLVVALAGNGLRALRATCATPCPSRKRAWALADQNALGAGGRLVPSTRTRCL